jgi:hypothetical protein
MAYQRQPRRATDTMLLAVWFIGYHALIMSFAALQRVERLLAGSKREGAKEARRRTWSPERTIRSLRDSRFFDL